MAKTVMTVTGPVSPASLGVTLIHEHFTFAYPGWYADWYPDYIFRRFIPRMKASGVTDEQIQGILADNPRRFLAGV